MSLSIRRGIVYAGLATTFLDRIERAPLDYYTAADLTGIVVRSYDLDTGLIVATTTLDPADVVGSVTTSRGWVEDEIGWNVLLELDGDNWPIGGRSYRIEVTYQPDGDDAFLGVYEVQAVSVYSGEA